MRQGSCIYFFHYDTIEGISMGGEYGYNTAAFFQAGIADPRRQWGNRRHKPEDIFIIGPAALWGNGEDFEYMRPSGRNGNGNCGSFWNCPTGYRTKARFSGYSSG
jgi:hypothetical protein